LSFLNKDGEEREKRVRNKQNLEFDEIGENKASNSNSPSSFRHIWWEANPSSFGLFQNLFRAHDPSKFLICRFIATIAAIGIAVAVSTEPTAIAIAVVVAVVVVVVVVVIAMTIVVVIVTVPTSGLRDVGGMSMGQLRHGDDFYEGARGRSGR
jgi:hypothetical protein